MKFAERIYDPKRINSFGFNESCTFLKIAQSKLLADTLLQKKKKKGSGKIWQI